MTRVCAGVIRYRKPNDRGGGILLWSGPKGPGRHNLVLRISKDEGRSFPGELLVGPGLASYSDLAVLDDGSVGILWEGGQRVLYEKIFFTRVPLKVIESL